MLNNIIKYGSKWFRIKFSKYPIFLNYPFSSICNLKCVMCNFYEGKRDKIISPEELGIVLKGKLFKNIEEVSFSGGEPFIQNNIEKYLEQLINSLPRLKGIYINTNGYNPEKISLILPELLSKCKTKNIKLMIIFSLDGLEDVHNYSRQKKDAWKRLIESLRIVKKLNIPVNILTTLHRYNYDSIVSIFHFCHREKIKVSINIAVQIGRLKNIDSFNDFEMTKLQKLYIWQFIQYLSGLPEFTIFQKIWYKELACLLLKEKKRDLPCLAQDKGVFLDYNGKISYCAIHHEYINNHHNDDCKNFFDKRNIKNIKATMLAKHCQYCMHNYQNIPRIIDLINYFYDNRYIKLFNLLLRNILKLSKNSINNVNNKKVVIFGCFGTETIGDKLILENIVRFFSENKNLDIYIASLVPQYTKATILEFEWENINIINYQELMNNLNLFDVAVFGGGPIMGNLHTLSYKKIASFFQKNNKNTIIWGAGWGPFYKNYKNKLYETWGIKFIKYSQVIAMRDRESCNILKSYLPEKEIKNIPDPAYTNILSQRINKKIRTDNVLGISFRSWTHEGKFKSCLDNHIDLLANCANYFIEHYNGKVILIPMNTFYIGGDDRLPLLEIYDKINKKSAVLNMTGFYGAKETVDAFKKCSCFIGMRFHSVAIATGLGIPTIGIDYIMPTGKITNFLKELHCEEYLLQLGEFSQDDLIFKLNKLLKNKQIINKLLLNVGNSALEKYEKFEREINHRLKLFK